MDLCDKRNLHGNSLVNILRRWGCHREDDKMNILVLNILLLGDRQSGRSSVGNALIGGHEFQTGMCTSAVSTTTECRLLSQNFPKCFRRQGAESDLILKVLDTPPQVPHPQILQELCPEGINVVVIVMRADLPQENTHLQEQAESLFGPEWHHHAVLVFTHADHLEEAGLCPSVYLTQSSDWLRTLAKDVKGGVCFLDNSCHWPSIVGRPLRDRVLRLSAQNHHGALRVRTEVSL
ncbi:GTPase IMAP family member GIMD1-like [Xenentodon cancila]